MLQVREGGHFSVLKLARYIRRDKRDIRDKNKIVWVGWLGTGFSVGVGCRFLFGVDCRGWVFFGGGMWGVGFGAWVDGFFSLTF